MKKLNMFLVLFITLFVGMVSAVLICNCPPTNPRPIFTPSADATITPIPLAAQSPQRSIHLTEQILSFAIRPDQRNIAIGTSNGVLLYDLKTFTLLRRLTEKVGSISSLAWSPDGTKLAAGNRSVLSNDSGLANVLVWDTSTWKVILEPTFGDNVGDEPIPALAWSPDNRSLAVSVPMNSVVVLDTQSGKTISNQQDFAMVAYDLAWSPDGVRLVATGDMAKGLRRWKISNNEAVRLFDKRLEHALQLAWSPDGTRIASAHGDGKVCLWTAANNECDGLIDADPKTTYSLAWSADGAKLATGGSIITIWDTQTGRPLSAFGKDEKVSYTRIQWPALNQPLVTLQRNENQQDGTLIRFWDVATGKILAEFAGL